MNRSPLSSVITSVLFCPHAAALDEMTIARATAAVRTRACTVLNAGRTTSSRTEGLRGSAAWPAGVGPRRSARAPGAADGNRERERLMIVLSPREMGRPTYRLSPKDRAARVSTAPHFRRFCAYVGAFPQAQGRDHNISPAASPRLVNVSRGFPDDTPFHRVPRLSERRMRQGSAYGADQKKAHTTDRHEWFTSSEDPPRSTEHRSRSCRAGLRPSVERTSSCRPPCGCRCSRSAP